MLQNIKGIVLRCTKYTDNSVIINMYTDKYGLQSYIARGVHSRTSKVKANYFRGLMLLDMIATKKGKAGLESISEVTGARSLTLEFDFTKSSIALFLNELLYKTIHEEEANPGLFEFLVNSLELLSLKEDNCANFHLLFMLRYSKYLGFYPSENFSATNKYFDMQEGRFVSDRPVHVYYLDETLSRYIYELMNEKFETCEQVRITNDERRSLMNALIEYYKLHNVLSADLTSQAVLAQL